MRTSLLRLGALFLVAVFVSLRQPGAFNSDLVGLRGQASYQSLRSWSGYHFGLMVAAFGLALLALLLFEFGWGLLICSLLAVLVLYLLNRGREHEIKGGEDIFSGFPVLTPQYLPSLPQISIPGGRAIVFSSLFILYSGWLAAIAFLATR